MSALRDPDSAPSRVAFVGAGPGDPLLLTLGALQALRTADLVLVDDARLLAMLTEPIVALPENVVVRELTGTAAPERAAECLEALTEARQVVRLFWGDPFLDGRGAMEAAGCSASGVDIHVIPGISPQTAVPEFAGVDLSRTCVQLVPEAGLADGGALGSGNQVISSTVAALDDVVACALRSGRTPDQPVVATANGTTTRQETARTTLGKLSPDLFDADDDAPVTVVIGDAAAAQLTEWFENKPLFGWRVLVPRTKAQSGTLIGRLRMHGAFPEEVPTIAVEPPRQPQLLDRAIRGLVEGNYEWVVFTSVNAVRAVRDKLEDYGLDARVFSGVRVAVVGESTAQSLRDWGIVADLMPVGEHSASGLAAEFPAYDDLLDPINKVFCPRADIAVDTLVTGLTELGWEVEDVTAYRTVRAAPPAAEIREAIKTGEFDAVLFTSSSTVRNLVGIAGKPHACSIIAAIGPATAATCEEHGLRVDVLASSPSSVVLADQLAEFAARRREEFLAKGAEVRKPSQRRRRRRKSS